MSWTRFASTVSAAVLVGWATCASAEEGEYGRSGPYLAGAAIYAFENFGDGKQSPDGSWGYNLRGGYRFNGYFALEIDWEQYVGFNHSTGDSDIWLIGLGGIFYPFQGIVQPFLGVGLGWSSVEDSRAPAEDDDGIAMLFDAGLDVYITRNWALTTSVGYYLPTSGVSNYDAIPLRFGVMYRFY
ncbi:MAG: outer membrane beta-barrel protein [Candidatus Binatia bacterium]